MFVNHTSIPRGMEVGGVLFAAACNQNLSSASQGGRIIYSFFRRLIALFVFHVPCDVIIIRCWPRIGTRAIILSSLLDHCHWTSTSPVGKTAGCVPLAVLSFVPIASAVFIKFRSSRETAGLNYNLSLLLLNHLADSAACGCVIIASDVSTNISVHVSAPDHKLSASRKQLLPSTASTTSTLKININRWSTRSPYEQAIE